MKCKTAFSFVVLLIFVSASQVFAKGQKEGTLDAASVAQALLENVEAVVEEATVPEPEPEPPPPPPREWVFTDLFETIWRLQKIKIGYGMLSLERDTMKSVGLNDVFIVQFREEGINGRAILNYFFAQYARREGRYVAFRQIVGSRPQSQSAAILGGLGEEEFYWYLQRAATWQVVDETLELHGFSGQEEIVLYFTHD